MAVAVVAVVTAGVLAACTVPPPPSRSAVPSATAESLAKQEAEPLVTATPDEHSEVGGLARGFPTDLIPVPEDAVILVTSAARVGDADVQEVSLNLHTELTTEQVLDLYRTALVAAGFTELDPPDSALAAEASFTRSSGDELVSIGVLDDGGTRTVTIGGRVHTTEP